jgi:hypothetical protein
MQRPLPVSPIRSARQAIGSHHRDYLANCSIGLSPFGATSDPLRAARTRRAPHRCTHARPRSDSLTGALRQVIKTYSTKED